MNGVPLSRSEINRIVRLRKTGHSLPEIERALKRNRSTIFRYVHAVQVLPEYRAALKAKQGGSKRRAQAAWKSARESAHTLIHTVTKRDLLLIAAMLYWGEGTKRDFSLSNTDPRLIKVFVRCLETMGIPKNDLRITARIYEDLDREATIGHWARIIGISQKRILNVNVLRGKKKGKLRYGMCRIRVRKGGRYLKLFQSIIELIAEKAKAPIAQVDRAADS